MKTIGVLGAGTWGMALSRVLSNHGHKVMVWSALPIMEKVHEVVAGKISPEEAVRELMDRKRGPE